MNKEKYERIVLEIIDSQIEDVITTSGESSFADDEYLGPGVQ